MIRAKSSSKKSIIAEELVMHEPPNAVRPLPKVPSRIQGLDNVLQGGFPKSRSTLIIGGPGTGKTVLGLEFLFRSALAGKPGLFISFEESVEAIRTNAATLGWDLKPLEEAGMIRLINGKMTPDAIVTGEFNLQGLLAIIGSQAQQIKAQFIVIDALDVLLRLMDNPSKERNELYTLYNWLSTHEYTALLSLKLQETNAYSGRYSFLEYLADCVIILDQRLTSQVNTRRLRIVKYRGSAYGSNEYPYVIDTQGVRLIPITEVSLQHAPIGSYLSTGYNQLNSILGGGLLKSSVTLIAGPSGSGKTCLASTIAHAACQRGEKVLFVSFEESADSLVLSMKSPGIDLRQDTKNDLLRIDSRMPEACGAEQHLIQIFDTLEVYHPGLVVFEAVSSCHRLGGDDISFAFLTRLTNQCRSKGITCVLTNQIERVFEENMISGIGMSSLIDTAILLNYKDALGEVNRTMLVLKSRGTAHSNQYWEYQITNHGINIVNAYVGDGEVLTGIQRQRQEARDELQQRQQQQLLEQRLRELAKLKTNKDAQLASMQVEIKNKELEVENLRNEIGIQQRDDHARQMLRGKNQEKRSARGLTK